MEVQVVEAERDSPCIDEPIREHSTAIPVIYLADRRKVQKVERELNQELSLVEAWGASVLGRCFPGFEYGF
ncbi:MAG: hypothetical protein BMS9Abin05_0592 [Rhodothermia bacterium]|nr:MAG: hypothetical protein BMS9Abin05_0592 [Rhodothermia bacterium]